MDFSTPDMGWMSRFTDAIQVWTAKLTTMDEVNVVGVITVGIGVVIIFMAFYGMFSVLTSRE